MSELSDIEEMDVVLFEPNDVSKQERKFFYKKLTIFFLKVYEVDSDSNTVESDNNTDLSENEESIAIFSTKTRVKEVYYSTVPIEYPKTSESGVATVYNITGWNNPRDCWKNMREDSFNFISIAKINFIWSIIQIYKKILL